MDNLLEYDFRHSRNPHRKDLYEQTRLGRLLETCQAWNIDDSLSLWAKGVQKSEIDFFEYGATERRLYRLMRDFGSDKGFGTSPVRMFSFGPELEDWRMWLRHPGDILLQDFWHSIESPEMHMPGAWVENGYQYHGL